ncbi:MAG: leucyl aminopeptidase [Planctomycetaceae bacterium]|nr:leucyl aminopeptidase [Planctomycetales bacterium]MCB9925693.1 leucyl aminopeptidase [Planctomycetaceae bacterium]
MRIVATKELATSIQCDAIVVGCYVGGEMQRAAGTIDQATGGAITRLVEVEEISGKVGELTKILVPSGVKATQVIVVGLGDRANLDRRAAFRAAAAPAKLLASKPRSHVAFYLDDHWDGDLLEAAVCGAMLGCQGQDLYRAEKKLTPFEQISWAVQSEAALANGRILGDAVSLTRRLVNEPANKIYPESFADAAADVAQACGLEIEVWDEKRLVTERCGALLAVAQGSTRSPRLVILRHNGGQAGDAPLAFVGKGVTFDSGGLSLKPSDSMKTMKCDMAGAATVMGAMQAIAKMKLPLNVVGLVGLVENMVNGDSYKLGDVLTARSGKTIEVLNTDAEGRLVLADVLDVAVELGAAKIVDLATLTGACLVALGLDTAGLMTNDQGWCDELAAAAQLCGEAAWQLPMFPEFGEQITSKVADIKNVGEGRWGGAITAAKFLEEFVQGKPWVHIDIAGPSFSDGPKAWLDAGGTGAFVRTLVELATGYRN